MYTIFSIFFATLGLCIGSFLNVVVLRHNTGLGISRERSMCFSCGRAIPWYENIPLLSYVFLLGRCSKCHSRISPQYPLVELLTGLLFLGVWFHLVTPESFAFGYDLTNLIILGKVLYYDVILSLLVVILVYDIKHKIIPNMFAYSFIVFSLAGLIVVNIENLTSTMFLMNVLAGPIFFLPFYVLWKVSNGRWIGLGDGKLSMGIGWLLGIVYGLSAIILAFWIGAVVSLLLLGLSRMRSSLPYRLVKYLPRISMKSEIPFAPFLILGVIIEFFWLVDVVGLSVII